MKKVWIIAGGVVVAAGLSAPWVVGKLTEQHWHTAAERFNDSQPYFVLETDSYERGYLGAEARGRLVAVHSENGKRYPLDWVGDISHGVTSSTIDFHFDLEDEPEMAAVFPDEQPTVTVNARAWGSVLVEVTVPAIHYTDEGDLNTLNVSESYAKVNVGRDGESLDAEVRLPGLVLRAPDARVTLNNLTMDQQATLLTGQLWTGDATMTMDKLTVAAQGEPEVVLEGFTMVSNSSADKGGERFGVTTTLTLDNASHGDESHGPHRMEFVLSDVDVVAWNGLLEAITTLQELEANTAGLDYQQAFEQQMRATMALTGSFEAMMTRGLSASTDLELSSPDGPITGRLAIAHPEQADGTQVPLMMMAGTITGELAVRLPKALATRYPELGVELAPAVMQGVLVEEGEDYVMNATLNDMIVNLNGNEVPLPVFGMGMPLL